MPEDTPKCLNEPKIQLNIKESFELQWPVNDARAKELHYSIAEMIAVDNQPMSIVEDSGFARLMNKMKPRYKLPSRKYMADVIIPDIYKRTKDALKNDLLHAVAISATTDMWTSDNSTHSFMSFTAHWLTDDFVPKHCVLQMKHFTGRHSGDNIRKMLLEITTFWEIPNEKIHTILRDNGSNVVKALNESNFTPIPCFIHTLQLVVNDSINVQENVIEMISAARRIITHFHHSESSQEKLKLYQQELDLPFHQLIQDVKTRWNSTFYMLERLLEQKRPITLYIIENDVTFQNLSSTQWQLLEDCLMLLKPFEEVTKRISSSVASISEVIPNVTTLLKYLARANIFSENISAMRLSLISGLKVRFKELEINENYFLATLLDPRYRMQFFTFEKVCFIRHKFFVESLRRELSSADSDSSSDDDNININLTASSETNTNQSHATFWECYKEIASTSALYNPPKKNRIAVELDAYLSEEILHKDHCPFAWWKKYSLKFPNMSQMAKVYLSAPASTVYSERLFSEAGNVYEKKRSRLLPERAESLVFLHHNLPLINYKY